MFLYSDHIEQPKTRAFVAVKFRDPELVRRIYGSFELATDAKGPIMKIGLEEYQLEWAVKSMTQHQLFEEVCAKFNGSGLSEVENTVHYGHATVHPTELPEFVSLYKYVGKLRDLNEFRVWAQTCPRFMRQEYEQRLDRMEFQLKKLEQSQREAGDELIRQGKHDAARLDQLEKRLEQLDQDRHDINARLVSMVEQWTAKRVTLSDW